jgi:hypothetical protein
MIRSLLATKTQSPRSPIHFDEFAFSNATAFASASLGGKWNKMCTWFSVPPTASAIIS